MASRKARISGFDSLSIGGTELLPDKKGIVEVPEELLQDPDFLRWVEETNNRPDHSFQVVEDAVPQEADKKADKKVDA
jgi:hypothetical protein